jgi:tRNA dimethylallyltransferase
MKSIGYKQVMSFINNEINENELFERTIFATRQLAKRQITWIKKFTEGIEIDLENQTLDHLFSMLDKRLHF